MFFVVLCLLSTTSFAQAPLPTSYAWAPSSSLPTGWTSSGMGSPYTSGSSSLGAPNAGKFDSSGDDLVIEFTEPAGELVYSLKAQPASGTNAVGVFDVFESVDGTNYTVLLSITNKINIYETYTNLPAASSRFVKLAYTTKTSGNIAIDDVSLAASSLPPLPTITFSESDFGTFSENSPDTQIRINISESASATAQVAVAGTAELNNDYTLSSTTVVFSAGGSTSVVITAAFIEDVPVEPEEIIELSFVNIEGALGGTNAQTSLELQDSSPAIWIANAPSNLNRTNESFTVTVGKTISISNVTGALSFGGTAVEGPDYSVSGNPFAINAVSTSTVITITLNTNSFADGNKTIEISLSNITGAQTVFPSAVTVTVGSFEQFTIMAANLSLQPNPSYSYYEETAGRLFEGLAPDIVAVQEFVVTNAGGVRSYVDDHFGTNFDFHVESTVDDGAALPNGIISRWPILQSGEWADTNINSRDFAWATIDLPGTQNLHIISVHLKASAGFEDRRVAQVQDVLSNIATSFPPNDLIMLAGDLNCEDRAEPALAILTNVFSDAHQPEDQYGDRDTNSSRNKPFDFVLPNQALELLHTTTIIDGTDFRNGIVFDSTKWSVPPSPILTNDSVTPFRQHMAVMKTYSFSPTDPPGDDDILVYYDFDTKAGLFEFYPERLHSHVTASNYISDDGVVNSLEGASGRAIKETGWNNVGSYYNFTMEIDSGYEAAITGLQFFGRSSGTGPTNWILESSLDDYLVPLATGLQANDSEWYRYAPSLNLSAVTGSVTFRITALNASSGTGSWANDSVKLYGSISLIGAEPPSDSNTNGIPDVWENLYFGSLGVSTNNNDFDLDGVTDLGEYLSGTIPTNENSVLRVVDVKPQLDGRNLVTWDSQSGKQYRVERAESFSGLYSNIATMVIGAPPINVVTDQPPVSTEMIYYRVILEP